jgi:hypothetical protein
MNANWTKFGLQQLKKIFRPILEDGTESVIDWAIAELESSKKRFDEWTRRSDDPHLTPQPWGYRIDPQLPLRFKPSSVIKGLGLWVDLYCTVLWMQEGTLPVKQEIHLCVWSNNMNYIYRPEWDPNVVLEKLTDPARLFNGRVILRCHFDLANPGQHGPKHHLQFGGEAREHELCWFPGIANLPRFVCPPTDLILACQLIAANFYWEEYKEFRKTPEWTGTLRRSQASLLRSYYKDCLNVLEQDRVLLDHLWNI